MNAWSNVPKRNLNRIYVKKSAPAGTSGWRALYHYYSDYFTLSFCPGLILLLAFNPLSLVSLANVMPLAAAILASESPFFTVYVFLPDFLLELLLLVLLYLLG